MADTKTRAELKAYFLKNSIPTEGHFAALIDAALNQKDDGLVKLPGNPLSIEAAGDNTSPKKALNLYRNLGEANADWTLSLNPRSDPNNAASAKAGFTISDGEGNHRLFIDRASGSVGVGTTEPGAKLDIRGDLKVGGTIYIGNRPLVYEDYEIYLRGSAFESTEGNNTFVRIANVSLGMTTNRGLNTVILNPDGTFKNKATNDIYVNVALWNTWADWVNSNAAAGDVVAVASYDALNNAPVGGTAETLLKAIGAVEAFRAVKGNNRSPYALLFIKGRAGAMEVSQSYRGPNAQVKISYYNLLNFTAGGADGASPFFKNGSFSGNVGIGAADPRQKLVIESAFNAGKEPQSGMSNGGNLAIKSNAPQIDFIDTDHNDWSIHVNAHKMYFIRQPWEFTDLVLDGGGNVGMGTDNPAAKLHVANHTLNNAAFQPLIKLTANQNNESADNALDETKASYGIEFYRQWNSGLQVLQAGIYAWGTHNWGSGLAFRTALDSGGLTTRLVITDQGNVGVGLTNPPQKLTVNGYVAASQVYFSAYVDVNTRSGDLDPLPMQQTAQNVGNGYNTATSKFTAPVKGVYLFTMTGHRVSSPITDWLHWRLMVNDDFANKGGTTSAEAAERGLISWEPNLYGVSSRTIILTLNAGDIVHVRQNGVGRCDNYRSGFEGVLLSATL
jgi:hypothetical protein